MTKSSFKEKLKFSIRKLMISIKRNYFIIPLIMVGVCCIQFMVELFILSPAFSRVNQNRFSALIIFCVSLFSILACVAYLNYALPKYGQKRPLHMLIIYYVLFALCLGMVIYLIINMKATIVEELKNQALVDPKSAQYSVYEKFLGLERKSVSALIVQFVMLVVTFVLVTSAPFIQKLLKKISFKKVSDE